MWKALFPIRPAVSMYFIFFENCMKNYKALLQQNICNVSWFHFFICAFIRANSFLYFCERKKYFFSRSFDPLKKVLLFSCYTVIAWCMFLKLEARAQHCCFEWPEVVTTSFTRASCSCRVLSSSLSWKFLRYLNIWRLDASYFY